MRLLGAPAAPWFAAAAAIGAICAALAVVAQAQEPDYRAPAPICALSNTAEWLLIDLPEPMLLSDPVESDDEGEETPGHVVIDVSARAGTAVIDIETGAVWTGGSAEPFAMHSVVKPPIAWLVLTDALERGEPLDDQERERLYQMVVYSKNEDVTPFLRSVGRMPALADYYRTLGAPGMTTHLHPFNWGIGRAAPLDVARLYQALAVSPIVPDSVRTEGLRLLSEVPDIHRWGAKTLPGGLPGWQSLLKTGLFFLGAEDEIVRLNSAAILTDQSGAPRYVAVIMMQGAYPFGIGQLFQNQLGEALAAGVEQRESGGGTMTPSCLKRLLTG